MFIAGQDELRVARGRSPACDVRYVVRVVVLVVLVVLVLVVLGVLVLVLVVLVVLFFFLFFFSSPDLNPSGAIILNSFVLTPFGCAGASTRRTRAG